MTRRFRVQGFVGTAEQPLVCVQNAQTIRRSLPGGGPVSVSDVENMLPPEEGLTMTIVEIERASLISVLENSVSTLNDANMCATPQQPHPLLPGLRHACTRPCTPV